jgi:hypothetical protein
VAVICASDSGASDANGHPLDHATDCPCGPACTMSACDAHVGVAATSGITINWSATAGRTLETTARARPTTVHAVGGSHRPRAPPVA